jgi:hypothetical protein
VRDGKFVFGARTIALTPRLLGLSCAFSTNAAASSIDAWLSLLTTPNTTTAPFIGTGAKNMSEALNSLTTRLGYRRRMQAGIKKFESTVASSGQRSATTSTSSHHVAPRSPKKARVDFRPSFATLRPWKRAHTGFRLRANAPEGQKRLPIS